MLRILMAFNAVAGTIFAAVGAYYTAAQYYGWKPNSEAPMGILPAVWPVAVLAIGVRSPRKIPLPRGLQIRFKESL
jgi:hypothetical protein